MYNFVSLIINTASSSAVDNTHSFFHVQFNLILQLIKGISNDLKKLLKYFNGTTIFTFNLPTRALSGSAAAILPNKLILYLKDVELSAGDLHYHLVVHLVYIDKALLMNLDNYLNILLNYT